MKYAALGALTALVLCIGAAPAAQPSMREVLRATYGVRDISNVALSPAGTALAWEESYHPGPDPSVTRIQSAVYLDGMRVAFPDAGADLSEPVWSPDGSRLAFLATPRKGGAALYTVDARGRNLRRVTVFSGNVQNPQWSPDGTSIAILDVAHPHRKTGALAAGAREVGVIGTSFDEQSLAVVDLKTGGVRLLTPADVYVYEYAWAPDSKRFAYTYAHGSGDNNWWIAKLATIELNTRTVSDVYAPKYQINDPQWSPDGKRIAFISGIMSDFGSVGGDVYLADPLTRIARDITPGMPYSAASLRWVDNGRLYLSAHSQGTLNLYRLNASTGSMSPLTRGDVAIRSWDVARGGARIAFVRTSFSEAPEVFAGTPTAVRQVSRSNAGARRLWGKAVSLHWKNEGYNVQGWLIYPLSYDPHKRYPMIAIVHGGPSAESLPGFGNRNIDALTSQGYFVFEPNPRGSFGQGEAFTKANVRDFGYGDWRDDLKGVDAAVAAAPIDPSKLGLFGWSYGGYMAMWAETQTSRFKAIVAGRGCRELAVVLRAEQHRRMDDSVLRRIGLPKSAGVREELAHNVHRALPYAGPDSTGRTR